MMQENRISSLKLRGRVLPSLRGDILADDQRFWKNWLLAVTVIALLFSITMDVAPFLHKDEFMVVDLGRVILHPDTKWAISWLTNEGQPAFVWFYVGPVLQELAFQVIGQYGPRVSGLLGAIAAATSVAGWLLARGTSKQAAFIFGLVFLLDPLFVQAYSLGRLDGWTMAMCITSCWILKDATHRLTKGGAYRKRVMLAGALAAVAFFTWPSAVFLFPLILLELVYLAIEYRSTEKSWIAITTPFILFVIGSMVMGILLLLPIAPQLYVQLSNIIEGLAINSRTAHTLGEQSVFLTLFSSFIEMLRSLKYSPILLFLALVGVIKRPEVGLILAGVATTTLMLCTVVYMHRVQYLLPYLVASAVVIYRLNDKAETNSLTPFAKNFGLALLLIWSIGLSLIVRSMLALHERAERDRYRVYQAAQSMIGKGSHGVLSPYEFYYAGSSLGWEMYAPYLPIGEPFSLEELKRILPYVDYVITNPEREDFIQELEESGMREVGRYFLYEGPVEKDDGKPTNGKRLRNLYHIFRKPYGPYRVYAREKNLSAAHDPKQTQRQMND